MTLVMVCKIAIWVMRTILMSLQISRASSSLIFLDLIISMLSFWICPFGCSNPILLIILVIK